MENVFLHSNEMLVSAVAFLMAAFVLYVSWRLEDFIPKRELANLSNSGKRALRLFVALMGLVFAFIGLEVLDSVFGLMVTYHSVAHSFIAIVGLGLILCGMVLMIEQVRLALR